MDIYGIADLSMKMSADKVQQQVGVSVLSKGMKAQKESAQQLLQALGAVAPAKAGEPGSVIDVKE
jgi:hypothetical protein